VEVRSAFLRICFAVLTADFNGDGSRILWRLSVSGNSVLAIFLGNGNGTLGRRRLFHRRYDTRDRAGNIRGNGKTDIAVVGVLSGTSSMQTITVYENDVAETSRVAVGNVHWSEPTSMVVADFNGDGKSDLALRIAAATT